MSPSIVAARVVPVLVRLDSSVPIVASSFVTAAAIAASKAVGPSEVGAVVLVAVSRRAAAAER